MRLSVTLLLVVLGTQIVSASDPFTTLIEYENNQRVSAQLNGTQYHLLPFRVSGTSQNFIQAPEMDEFLNVEVLVHWITNSSVLKFPDFDLSQKVRLVIEQENVRVAPRRKILTRQFLTQTGFKLQLKAGCRYRWKIESSGQVSKLVEIAIKNKAKHSNSSAIQTKKSHQEEVQVLREMSRTLEKAKQARTYRESQVKQSQVADMWAWMSGMEIASLLGFLLVQLALFQKFMLPTSVV